MNLIVKKLPQNCPSCESRLKVRQLHCPVCATEVGGSYDLPILTRFSDEEQDFILNFIKTSGSLKEMAKIMEKSYPSVRNYLDDLIEKLVAMEQNDKTHE